ncbi:hypothetical protein [Mesorhizobium sp. B2-4-19]|uniref:hypothetical protein n=1 Tax=Mesorhizobium sp. B2-4-19 TaxID=2589930 RepID=UPI001FED2FBB|nr:hypothetical protein [Mesorhizobium sp. B2-4-19]
MAHVIPLSIAQRRLDTGNAPQYPQGSPVGGAMQGLGDQDSRSTRRHHLSEAQRCCGVEGSGQHATTAQLIGARARVLLAEQNAPAVIAATGKYPEEEPTAQDFVNIYGTEDGPKHFDQFRTTAGVAKSFFDMYRVPNQAIHAELRDFEPSTDSSPEERERYEVRAGAAQLILSARDADPASYVGQLFPGQAPDWSKVSTPQDFQAAVTWTRAAQQQMGFDRKLPLPWSVADQEAKQYIDPNVPFSKRFARASSIVLAIRDPGARKATAEQFSVAAEAQWRARAARDPNMTPELLEAQLTALRAGLAWIGEHPAQAQYSTMSSLQQFGMAFGDIGRTIAKGATAGGADALVAGMAPSESGESYHERLGREQAETEDAEDRAVLAGWVAEGLGAGLSGYGAAKGLFGLLGRAGGVGAAAETGLTGLGARTAVGAATGEDQPGVPGNQWAHHMLLATIGRALRLQSTARDLSKGSLAWCCLSQVRPKRLKYLTISRLTMTSWS